MGLVSRRPHVVCCRTQLGARAGALTGCGADGDDGLVAGAVAGVVRATEGR